MVSMFTDNTNIARDVDSKEGCQDTVRLGSVKDMGGKMSDGISSDQGVFIVNDKTLKIIDVQRDLVVQVYRSLKGSTQVDGDNKCLCCTWLHWPKH